LELAKKPTDREVKPSLTQKSMPFLIKVLVRGKFVIKRLFLIS